MNSIENILNDLKLMQFPDEIADIKSNDLDPVAVNKLAFACAHAFLKKGQLNSADKNNLDRCLSDLRILNPKLVGGAQVYFGKLYRLCDVVYQQAS